MLGVILSSRKERRITSLAVGQWPPASHFTMCSIAARSLEDTENLENLENIAGTVGVAG
jgi:hypothetical protein